MGKGNKGETKSILRRAWEDTWKWLLNTKLGWLAAIIGGGVMGGIFVGDSLLERVLAGFTGAVIAMILIFGITFVIHLIITPSRLRKEARRKFIKNSASYTSTIIGNQTKQKYLDVLDILKSMIEIENKVADSMASRPVFSNSELLVLQKKLSGQTGIATMPLHKAKRLLLEGKYVNKIVQTINKLDLQIMGDKPTDVQIEFLVKTRSVLDDCGVGLSNGLEKSDEYAELLRRFYEEIPDIDDSTPEWVLLLLTMPSGVNSGYLLWSRLPAPSKNRLSQSPFDMTDFLSQRETGIMELIEYAEKEIEKL